MVRQRLGQHFLDDSAWQQRIAATLTSNPGEVWIEIGAGHGQMTRLLARKAARLIAIERDPALAQGLIEKVRENPAQWTGVEVIAGDVLTCDFAHLCAGRFRVYGNLPYYITSPILRHLFKYANCIDSIHIVIQFEVAERIAARAGTRDYGYLSVLSQFYSSPKIVLQIPPGAFRPPPEVYSALVAMTMPGERKCMGLNDQREEAAFLEFVQRCFRQKRRTLRNNLRPLSSGAQIESALQECGLRNDARAEQLTVSQFAQIFKRLG